MLFAGEKKSEGGKYFEKENTFMVGRRRMKEKEGNILRGKIIYAEEMDKGEGKGGKYQGEGKYIFLQRRIKTGKEKEKYVWRWKIFFFGDGAEN